MFSVPDSLKGIAETLFFPLYIRALETLRKDAIFRDPLAVSLVSQIDYDFSRLKYYDLLNSVVALRARQFDQYTTDFIENNPEGIIVNLGCGLDTRFLRLDNGFLRWCEIDLPEVIAFRQCFFEETIRYQYIAGSVLNADCFDSLKLSETSALLFLAEGLFPYFQEKQLRSLLIKLKCLFPGAILIFDAVSPLQMILSRFHPVFHIFNVSVQWGLEHAESIEKWDSGLHLLWQDYYFNQQEPRLGWHRLLQIFPHIRYGFSLVSLQFEPE